ncbi:MAG TPA: DUF2090 domain-containing protein, partial [Devosiaceae bacterium]|nr:DUF2090 domain-containing protein [Devosiaceae bacterium]
ELYRSAIMPDWWKLEPQGSASAWEKIEATITTWDPRCRGVVMLGLDAPQIELEKAFAVAARSPIVKGFAVGRTIFADAARRWLGGEIGDQAAIDDMATRFADLCAAWQSQRGEAAVASKGSVGR